MKVRAVKGILVKDLREIGREKMTVFWIIVFPMMWLLVMGGIWGHTSPPVTVKVGVVGGDAGRVVAYMSNVTIDGRHLFKVEEFGSAGKALSALKSGKLDAVIVFPRGFGENVSSGLPAKVLVYYDESDPQEYQIAKGAIEGFFSGFSRELAVRRAGHLTAVVERLLPRNTSERLTPLIWGTANPLTVEEKEVNGEKPKPVLFFLAGVMGIQFLFATMSLIGNGTLREIEKGTLRRIAASPATAWDFLLGKLLSTTVVIFGSIVALIIFSRVAFGATIIPSPLGWALLLTAGAFSMGLGLAIAMLTRSIRATSAAINLVSWPMMFLAGIVVPPSTLPNWARPFVDYFPIGRALKDFRLLEIYHVSPGNVVGDLLPLAAVSIGTLAVAVAVYGWAVKRLE
ncbi:ABC transporter permease [Thermococcus henrietii]|uniref:ABC transporter permease n=1 Tax=Thermococcus henrietii TaxID=2016361 RepID=UPI000C06DF23|nr:ABC transporter permease [Thermococcus henrietii]